ncbi:MAG: signal recognition particle-docking protein FtsY [Actinomycetota bacterium]|nr:signal recognition particle-docking protein FtsY [Actinomycetota bacterium]
MAFVILIVVLFVAAVAAGAFVGVRVRSRRARGDLESTPPGEKAPPTRPPPPADGKAVGAPAQAEKAGRTDRLGTEAAPGAGAAPQQAPPPAPGPADEAPGEGPLPVGEAPSLRSRLGKARNLLSGYVGGVLARGTIDATTWDDLEEALLGVDVGVATTDVLLAELRGLVKAERIKDPARLTDVLKERLVDEMRFDDRSLHFEPGVPNVWLFVGVNGVGKTTTIGKIARRQVADERRTVVMAAGDTFRAAAADQLELWARRVDAEIVRGAEGGDPSAVVFDAVQRAAARGRDLVLADTAGRLHTRINLMEELKKVRRVADRPPAKVSETLLVIDATTGQNGLAQARQFADAAGVTGVVLTKLDGTARGGIVVAIQRDLGLPVKLVGIGEGPEDLIPFDPEEFVEALFS